MCRPRTRTKLNTSTKLSNYRAMDIEKLKNEIALKHGYQDGILGNAWDFAMQLTHRTKRQIALYEEVVAALAEYSHDTPAALPLHGVVFSDQQERSRFQKDIDDCYAHEDEEENEAEVCLAPSYRIIGCEYNDGRTCDGCKWLPKQT